MPRAGGGEEPAAPTGMLIYCAPAAATSSRACGLGSLSSASSAAAVSVAGVVGGGPWEARAVEGCVGVIVAAAVGSGAPAPVRSAAAATPAAGGSRRRGPMQAAATAEPRARARSHVGEERRGARAQGGEGGGGRRRRQRGPYPRVRFEGSITRCRFIVHSHADRIDSNQQPN